MDTYKPNYSKLLHTDHIFPPVGGTGHINVGKQERVISTLGGGVLALLGMKQAGVTGFAMGVAGGMMLFRGATGYCPMNAILERDTSDGQQDISVEIIETITVERPRSDVYQYWRLLDTLPRFMEHLEDVRQLTPHQSHWVARIPGGVGTLSWDAEITQEKENEILAWRSMPHADINNAGEVRFQDSPDGKGTIIQAVISYSPPVGAVGGLAAKMLNPTFKTLVRKDLRNFKRYVELGEVPHKRDQPLNAN